jgi:serine protease Do
LVLVTALCVSLFSSLGAYAVFSSFNPGGKTITPIIGSALGGSVPATTTGGANPAQIVSLTSDQAIVRAVAAVKPSVVTITTTGDTTGRFNSLVPYTGSGSGFIAGANGLILTNNHVIDGASSISVTLDSGKTYAASVLTADATHDLALLKIAAEGLPVLSLGDSSTVQLGEEIIAMGNPLGTFADSVSQGIVAGLDRSISVGDSGAGLTENLSGLIQTDAAINPGNSGGPMFDVNGEVVGIITASSSDASSLGFAVPINTAKAMISTAG